MVNRQTVGKPTKHSGWNFSAFTSLDFQKKVKNAVAPPLKLNLKTQQLRPKKGESFWMKSIEFPGCGRDEFWRQWFGSQFYPSKLQGGPRHQTLKQNLRSPSSIIIHPHFPFLYPQVSPFPFVLTHDPSMGLVWYIYRSMNGWFILGKCW